MFNFHYKTIFLGFFVLGTINCAPNNNYDYADTHENPEQEDTMIEEFDMELHAENSQEDDNIFLPQENNTTSSLLPMEFSDLNFSKEVTPTTTPLITSNETIPTPFSFDIPAFDSVVNYDLPNFQPPGDQILPEKRSYDQYPNSQSRQPYGYTMLMDNLYKALGDIELLRRATKRSFERLERHLADTEYRIHNIDTVTIRNLFKSDQKTNRLIAQERAETSRNFKTMEEKTKTEFKNTENSRLTIKSQLQNKIQEMNSQFQYQLTQNEQATNLKFQQTDGKAAEDRQNLESLIKQEADRTNALINEKEVASKAGLQQAKEGIDKLNQELEKVKESAKRNREFTETHIRRVDSNYVNLRHETSEMDKNYSSKFII